MIQKIITKLDGFVKRFLRKHEGELFKYLGIFFTMSFFMFIAVYINHANIH